MRIDKVLCDEVMNFLVSFPLQNHGGGGKSWWLDGCIMERWVAVTL